MHEEPSILVKIMKEMPLETRLKVPLEMEYLNIILEPDTCCTDEHMTNYLLKEVEGWINDGASLRKESDSLTTPEGE